MDLLGQNVRHTTGEWVWYFLANLIKHVFIHIAHLPAKVHPCLSWRWMDKISDLLHKPFVFNPRPPPPPLKHWYHWICTLCTIFGNALIWRFQPKQEENRGRVTQWRSFGQLPNFILIWKLVEDTRGSPILLSKYPWLHQKSRKSYLLIQNPLQFRLQLQLLILI